MEKEYYQIGRKMNYEGKTLYQSGATDNGFVYKDEKAFYENPDEVCYIPEYGFGDADEYEINNEIWYDVNSNSAYTRNQLEKVLIDDEGDMITDDEDKPIDVEGLFGELDWAYPETVVNNWC